MDNNFDVEAFVGDSAEKIIEDVASNLKHAKTKDGKFVVEKNGQIVQNELTINNVTFFSQAGK